MNSFTIRSITRKRAAILVCGLTAVVGSIYALQRYQVTKLAERVDKQAARALEKGEYLKAAALYSEHLAVLPTDVEAKIKYADALLKGSPTLRQQSIALNVYHEILYQYPGRHEVRLKRAEAIMGLKGIGDATTQIDLEILMKLPEYKDNGHIRFLLGKCYEVNQSDEKAQTCFAEAIKNDTPPDEKIEAYERLASLLRQSRGLNNSTEADRVIEEMIKLSPNNYKTYVARGRYRQQFGLPGAKADMEKALSLAGDRYEIYLDMSRAARTENGKITEATQNAARQILAEGIKKIPGSHDLVLELADLENKSGHADKAIEVMEQGLKSVENKTALHFTLATVLARRGETGKLLVQIDELKRHGFSEKVTGLLKGNYYVNSSQFKLARQTLAPLETWPLWTPQLKARLTYLLAQCYEHLGEPGLQREAYLRAINTNPADADAKLGLIRHLIERGQLDEAITAYREIVRQIPSLGVPLAGLLVQRNQQRPVRQRDWSEPTKVLDAAEKAGQPSVQSTLIRVDLELAQDRPAKAQAILDKSRSLFPKDVTIRCAQANLLMGTKQFAQANRLLDEAIKELGDSVEVRLQRARLAGAEGKPKFSAKLKELSENLEVFSKSDRRKLLDGLATECLRQQDRLGANRLWSVMVDQDPNDLDGRLKVLEVSLELGDAKQIENVIAEIEKIEGAEGTMGLLCKVRYVTWQAEKAMDKKDFAEALRQRTKARVLLSELEGRRPDLAAVPLSFARLDLQELRDPKLTEAQILAKEEDIIRSYLRAIDLGQRSSPIMRETVRLLFKHKRGTEALDLVNTIPVETQLASDLERQAISFAIGNREFERAETLARKAVAAKPAELPERIFLAQILIHEGRQADAEAVLREAVTIVKGDPDRRILLTDFLVRTGQPAAAIKFIKETESALSPADAPVALGHCYALLGRYYEAKDEVEKKKWFAAANAWYTKAQAARPDDLNLARNIAEYLSKTNQAAELEAQLEAILKRGAKATSAWARRSLAILLASSKDVNRVRSAVSIMDPSGEAVKGMTTPQDPDDVRALAKVLDAQQSAPKRERAAALLNSLVAKGTANMADRLTLARLEELCGRWPKALALFRDPKLSTLNAQDAEAVKLRPFYLVQFARGLIRNHKPGDDADLNEAQKLADELAQRQPELLETLALSVDVLRARNRVEEAVELIETSARRPKLSADGLRFLAVSAEQFKRLDLAERLFRQYAALPKVKDGTPALARFLGRHGRVKEGLDLLAPAWNDERDLESLAALCFQVLMFSDKRADDSQFERVAGWLEQAMKKKSDSGSLVFLLGDVRAEQKRFDEAQALYRGIPDRLARSTMAPAEKNKMLAMAYNNTAWLAALKDGQGENALADVNRAIDLIGPQADLLDTRGIIHLSLKQTQDAIKDLEKANQTAPSPNKLFHLAQAYFQANEKEKSKQFLKEAKAKGLDRTQAGPGALHALEQPAYQKLLAELGLS